MRKTQIEKCTNRETQRLNDVRIETKPPRSKEDYFSQVSNPGDQNSELLKRRQSRWSFQGDQISELLKRGSVSGNVVRGLKKVFYSRA